MLTKRINCLLRCKRHLNMRWPNPYQKNAHKASQHVLKNHNPCQWKHKIYLNVCWPSRIMPKKDKMHLNLCWPKTCQRRHKINLDLYWLIPPKPAKIQNAYQLLLSKRFPSQRGKKINLNLCWENQCHVSGVTICILTCVDKTHHMPARTQNLSQHMLIKLLPCQRGHVFSKPVPWQGTQKNATQLVLTKQILCQRRHTIYLYLWYPNHFCSSTDTKFNSTSQLPMRLLYHYKKGNT